jgi:GntR family transcriptional regulator
MYAYLEREYGLSDAATEQAIQVDQPSQEEWRVLGLRASASVVRIRGISFDASGTAFDCYEQVYGASNFVFYITNVDRRELLQPGDRGDWLVEPFGLSRQRDDSEGRADS